MEFITDVVGVRHIPLTYSRYHLQTEQRKTKVHFASEGGLRNRKISLKYLLTGLAGSRERIYSSDHAPRWYRQIEEIETREILKG